MRPDIVTFWHGPLDALRRTCLRSQVAAGHKVTVYSFDPLPDCPMASAMPRPRRSCRMLSPKSCARPEPDGSGATGPRCSSGFFPDAADGAAAPACGSMPTCCCSSRSRSIRQSPISPGNGGASSATPCSICRRDDPIVAAFEELMEQDELTPDWLALRHRLTFVLRQLRGGSNRLVRYSRCDLRPGGADRAGPPRRRAAATRCRRNHFMRFTPNRNCSSSRRIFPR